jgi:Domain of unknown function (DUF4124)
VKLPLPIVIAIALLLATATVTAQVHKCVDKDGKVQYSDIPPPADAKCTTAKKLDTRAASSPLELPPATSKAASDTKANKDGKAKDAKAKDGPKTLADKTKDFDKRRADEADTAKKDADAERVAKANKARCTDSTNYLRDLESGRPLASSDEKGERVILDDAARNVQMERARTAMTESCK